MPFFLMPSSLMGAPLLDTVDASPGRVAQRPTRGLRSVVTWWPPVAAFALSNLVFWYAGHRHGYDWLNAMSRYRVDAMHYVSIADHGYVTEPCHGWTQVTDDPASWCGNIGWFPLYPLVLRPFRLLGLSWQGTAAMVSELALLGMLLALWHLLGARVTARNVACVALATVWPGAVYYHADFPTSLAVLLALVTWLLVLRHRWLLAAIAGCLTSLTYPVAVLLAPAVGVYILATSRLRSWSWLGRASLVCGLTAAGTPAAFALIAKDTGHFDSYVATQSHVGTGAIHNPVTTYLGLVNGGGLRGSPIGARPMTTAEVTHTFAGELIITLALVVICVAALGWAATRRRANALDLALVVYGLLVFTVPLAVGPQITQIRSHALLVPLVLVLRHVHAVVVGACVVAATALAYYVTVTYLQYALV